VRLEEAVSGGGRPVDPLADSPIGLTLAEGKTILAIAQARLGGLSPDPRSQSVVPRAVAAINGA
jgi:hypothetical protein